MSVAGRCDPRDDIEITLWIDFEPLAPVKRPSFRVGSGAGRSLSSNAPTEGRSKALSHGGAELVLVDEYRRTGEKQRPIDSFTYAAADVLSRFSPR